MYKCFYNFSQKQPPEGLYNTSGELFLPVQDGLRLWVDASYPQADGSYYANNTLLATIYDRSGNNAVLNNGTAAQQPLFILNSLNGLPGIGFSGNQLLNLATNLLANGNSSYTVFAVAKGTSNTVNRYLFFMGTNSNNNALFFRYETGARFQTGWFANGTISANNTWPLNANVILDSSYAGPGTVRHQFINGAPAGDGVNDLFNFAQSLARLGYNTVSGSPFIGYVYDFLFYNRSLSDDEKSVIRQYLSTKWGIALS